MRERIHQAFVCRRCGGSKLWDATAWTGRGNFAAGGREYAPRQMETLSPVSHCCCPGSMVWQLLYGLSSPDEQRALDAAQRAWDADASAVRLPMPEGDVAVMTPAQWREFVQAHWEAR